MLGRDCSRRYRLALVLLAALAGCAGQPRPTTPAAKAIPASGADPAAAATSAAAGGLSATTAAPAATAASAATAGTAASAATAASANTKAGKADPKFKPPSGWSTRVKNGETVYCRSDSAVGSRIPVKYCLSQGDLQELLLRQKLSKEELERVRLGSPTVCPNSAVCN
jgi:hypothetical protein